MGLPLGRRRRLAWRRQVSAALHGAGCGFQILETFSSSHNTSRRGSAGGARFPLASADVECGTTLQQPRAERTIRARVSVARTGRGAFYWRLLAERCWRKTGGPLPLFVHLPIRQLDLS